MRRVPVIPTLIVFAAVALMIALGLWQLLDRLPQKQAYLAQLSANPAKPEIAFPRRPDPVSLFRRTRAICAPPVAVSLAGAGAHGYRAIARCHASADAPGPIVQLGTTRDPLSKVIWDGGAVAGYVGQAPDGRPWVATLFSRRLPEPMLVADPPLGGLAANQRRDPADIPNNHLSYAVQWFLFAATALVIYALAVRARIGR